MHVDDTLPIPHSCNVCNSKRIVFTTNKAIYGRDHGDWPYIYLCESCNACVGCHKGTKKPMGLLANSKTRRLRTKAHEFFDVIWRKEYLSRKDAYDKLAEFLGIKPSQCHISWLNDRQLETTVNWSRTYMKENPPILRRQVKKDAKKRERLIRESKHVNRRKTNRRARFSRSN